MTLDRRYTRTSLRRDGGQCLVARRRCTAPGAVAAADGLRAERNPRRLGQRQFHLGRQLLTTVWPRTTTLLSARWGLRKLPRCCSKRPRLHPAMGYWLNMQGSKKGDLTTGYASQRKLWPRDHAAFLRRPEPPVVGRQRWCSIRKAISCRPTIKETITNGFARVFTGWTLASDIFRADGSQLPTRLFNPSTKLDRCR